MEVNERFAIGDDYSSLPINIRVPSFAISNNFKKLMAMNTAVLLTTSSYLSEEGSRFVKQCMLMCKYTTYTSVRCITFNLEWFGNVRNPSLWKENKANSRAEDDAKSAEVGRAKWVTGAT